MGYNSNYNFSLSASEWYYLASVRVSLIIVVCHPAELVEEGRHEILLVGLLDVTKEGDGGSAYIHVQA